MIDVIYNKWYYGFSRYAGVAELADAPDLGSGALRRGGSSPFSRTNYICTCRCFFFAHLHLFKETGIFWLIGQKVCVKTLITLDIY